MEGEGGGGPGWGQKAWSNRPFALQLSVWGVESVSRGPRKLRGAHLDSRRLSNLILSLAKRPLQTYRLPRLVLSAAVAAKTALNPRY